MFKNLLLCSLVIFQCVSIAQEVTWANSLSNGFRQSAKIEYSKKSTEPKTIIENKNALSIDSQKKLEDIFKRNSPRSVLVSVNNELVYEKYLHWGGAYSTPLGMSMSKSLTSLAVGKAICNGHIKSIDDKIQMYVPKLTGTSWGEASVKQVLKMSSGAYITYLSRNGHKSGAMERKVSGVLEGKMHENFFDVMHNEDTKIINAGDQWNYSNFDTVALAMLVEHSTKMSLAKFFEKEIWEPIGAEANGAWILNNHGQVSAHNGFSARPKDWLRLGQWMMNELENKDDCFGQYLKDAVSPWMSTSAPVGEYGYQIWVKCGNNIDFCFIGYAGQNMAFNRKHKLVAYQHAAFANPYSYWSFIHEIDQFIETEFKK